ncbi:hypothetical protein WR25_13620 isoform B [Diploscapter pachys]|uniref:Uncharacterized protein n=1 Tax=Diploscapter pachys TaxID=2018661 RepID=A0A2A2KQ76_9BILA|nr:hypothetical protein WR25_13620 isoform B [Diploscapter pachys]
MSFFQLEMGNRFTYGPDDVQGTPSASAAINGQPTLTPAATRTQPVEQAVVPNPMKDWQQMAGETAQGKDRNKDGAAEKTEVQQQQALTISKQLADSDLATSSVKQSIKSFGFESSDDSSDEVHKKDGESSQQRSAYKHSPTPFGSPVSSHSARPRHSMQLQGNASPFVSRHNQSPVNPNSNVPSQRSSPRNAANKFKQQEATKSPSVRSPLPTVQSHTFSPKEFPVRPPFANETPVFAKKTQKFSPKVEEHKPSPQSQQKRKKWTEQDEVAMKPCGGVSIDMIDTCTLQSVPSSTEHGQFNATFTLPLDLSMAESTDSWESNAPRIHNLNQSMNRTFDQSLNQSFNQSLRDRDSSGRVFFQVFRAPPPAGGASQVQTDSSGFSIPQLSFGQGNANLRGNRSHGRGERRPYRYRTGHNRFGGSR